jgi:hypothetical protein
VASASSNPISPTAFLRFSGVLSAIDLWFAPFCERLCASGVTADKVTSLNGCLVYRMKQQRTVLLGIRG